MGDLAARRTTYVLDATAVFPNWKASRSRAFPRMMGYVDANYEVVGTVDGVRILRRRDCGELQACADAGGRRLPARSAPVSPQDDGG